MIKRKIYGFFLREVDAEVTDAEIALTEAPVVSELHHAARRKAKPPVLSLKGHRG